jgi:predicted NBD/HSP70 family sugar kinase/predicted transcriptional regulator
MKVGEAMKQNPINSMQVKQLNTELLKSVLKLEKYCTKPDLAKQSGLSVSTCGNILKDLLETQEVIEISLNESTGGRPAKLYMFNESYASVATIYARKEENKVTLSCSVSNLLGVAIFETTLNFYDIGIKEIQTAITMLLTDYPNIKIVSLGLPAIILYGNVGYCDFPQLTNIPIVELLEERYPIQVIAENDVNATAMGYHKRNMLSTKEHIAYLYYPKLGNAGSGLIVHGQILHGAQHFAGEIAFLPLGVPFKEQGELQKDLDRFSNFVDRTLQSINCIINPTTIILAGLGFTPEMKEQIQLKLQKSVDASHRPGLVFETDIHENYLYGLTMLALDKLSCRIQIIERI